MVTQRTETKSFLLAFILDKGINYRETGGMRQEEDQTLRAILVVACCGCDTRNNKKNKKNSSVGI